MKRLKVWFQQPTSIAGFATIFGTISAVLNHQMNTAQAMPLFAAAIVSIAIPDNTSPTKPESTNREAADQNSTYKKGE